MTRSPTKRRKFAKWRRFAGDIELSGVEPGGADAGKQQGLVSCPPQVVVSGIRISQIQIATLCQGLSLDWPLQLVEEVVP